jgi:hypothetical protein
MHRQTSQSTKQLMTRLTLTRNTHIIHEHLLFVIRRSNQDGESSKKHMYSNYTYFKVFQTLGSIGGASPGRQITMTFWKLKKKRFAR